MFHRIPHRKHPLVEGTIFAENPLIGAATQASVSIAGRRARILLLPRWPVLFRGVRNFGRVISSCRNPYAILGRVAVYPEVWVTPCGQNAHGGDDELKFFFPRWSRAFVVVEAQGASWSYEVEFQNFYGEVIHTICLTPDSDFEAFGWWVRLNQAKGAETEFPSYQRTLCGGEGPAALCQGETSFLRDKDLRLLLGKIIETELDVRVFVENDGLVQGADMRPNCLREDGSWIYLGDDHSGLQLRVGRLAEIALHRLCHSSDGILKAYEPEGRLVCSILPSRKSSAGPWHELLCSLMPSFQRPPAE